MTGETVRDAANRVWAYLRGAWTAYREALDQLPAGAPPPRSPVNVSCWFCSTSLAMGEYPPPGVVASPSTVSPSRVASVGVTPIHLLGSGTPLDTRTGASRVLPGHHRSRWSGTCSTQ